MREHTPRIMPCQHDFFERCFYGAQEIVKDVCLLGLGWIAADLD